MKTLVAEQLQLPTLEFLERQPVNAMVPVRRVETAVVDPPPAHSLAVVPVQRIQQALVPKKPMVRRVHTNITVQQPVEATAPVQPVQQTLEIQPPAVQRESFDRRIFTRPLD